MVHKEKTDYLQAKPINEIIEVVKHLLDSKEEFTAYSIEIFLNASGFSFTRGTVLNLRNNKTPLEHASLSTVAKLYYFAEHHKGVKNEND